MRKLGVIWVQEMITLESNCGRGAGGPQFSMVHQFELNDPEPVNVAGSWTNITWDPTEELGGYNWNLGFLFHSNGGGATSGFRVDDFVVFGVEKVDNFTIDVDCINPENGIFPSTDIPLIK